MTHSFSNVPSVQIPRSTFNRSHGYKTCFDAGYLIPMLVDEVLPGDTFNVNMAAYSRLSTPTFPIMDNMYMDTFFFAVPLRLVWDNFKRFMGEQDNPADSTDFEVPYQSKGGTGWGLNSLHDYMGVPIGVPDLEVNSLFFRAYNLIWNEWFRDENLQDSVVVDKDDGPDTPSDYLLLKRGKRHDYFTSALPWPQKGDSVELPLGTTAPVTGIGNVSQTYVAGPNNVYETAGTGTTAYADFRYTNTATNLVVEEDPNNAGFPGIYADLSSATAATINQLRQAFQIQKLLERDARGGTRYTELVRSHFGVISPDSRLQRSEYLGGGSTPINVTPVLTASDSGVRDVGDTGAFATTAINGHGFTKSFTEHSIIIGLVSVRADLTYQQGLNKMFSRKTKYDFYWPALSHIGEQTIANREIYAVGSTVPGQDDEAFGYQERYAEYRYKPSTITGQFRSTAALTLDAWHLSQEFTSLPTLSSTFITEDPPIDRVINVPSEPHFIFDSYFQMNCARPMPIYGVPGLIDHF